MKKTDTRANGDLTRTKIFAAAKKLFPLYGFKGTSTQMLAAKAHVNEALIFHHFKNKEELWKKTKQAILEEKINKESVTTTLADLDSQLRKMIQERFDMFDQSPTLIRMLQWQRLENKKGQIQGGNQGSPEHWVEIFKRLKKENKIRQDRDPELLTIMITNAISGALMDEHAIFNNPEKKIEYVNLLVETFINSIKT